MYIIKAKYNGKNNNFSFKLTIFHDIYAKVNIPQDILSKVFLTMLINLVLDYYYSNISISIVATFEKVCNTIRTYFEKAEYKKTDYLNRT